MRCILIALLCLGIGTAALSVFQRSFEVARWSQIYGILEERPDLNPLKDESIRRRFNALYRSDTGPVRLTFWFGSAVVALAAVGLLLDRSSGNRNKNESDETTKR